MKTFHIFIVYKDKENIVMKTMGGIEITYEMTYNLLESLKPRFRDGSTVLNTISYCQDVLSDGRLNYYPDVELLRNNSILFDYELDSTNHLALRIDSYGFDYEDNVISYFYIKGDKTESKSNVSWNDVVDVVNTWHAIN